MIRYYAYKLPVPDMALYQSITDRLIRNGFSFMSSGSKNVVERMLSQDACLAVDVEDGYFKVCSQQIATTQKDHCLCSFETLIELSYKPPIKLKLNDEYLAIVSKEGITVGCQKFSIEKFKELQEAVEKVRNS